LDAFEAVQDASARRRFFSALLGFCSAVVVRKKKLMVTGVSPIIPNEKKNNEKDNVRSTGPTVIDWTLTMPLRDLSMRRHSLQT
jgi:hypothetical protein